MENFFDRSFTVYDSMLDTGESLNGGYIVAAVFASKADADAAMAPYLADRRRYDVRPSGAQAVAEAAAEIAMRMGGSAQ